MLAIMTTQYYTASSIDGLIADSENSLSWLFQFSEPSGMEDEYPRFIAELARWRWAPRRTSGSPSTPAF